MNKSFNFLKEWITNLNFEVSVKHSSFENYYSNLKNSKFDCAFLSDYNHESSENSWFCSQVILELVIKNNTITISTTESSLTEQITNDEYFLLLDNLSILIQSVPENYILGGYLSYELGEKIEIFKNRFTSFRDNDVYLAFYRNCSHFNHIQNLITEISVTNKLWISLNKAEIPFPKTGRSDDKNSYMTKVEKIRNLIRHGEVYQVNLSQRFCVESDKDSRELFFSTFENNPAPFYFYINTNDEEIVSTSPERFIKWDAGFLETRPIKGTIKRGLSEKEDEINREWLINSQKDESELSMIIDLMRNDISKISHYNSVKVESEGNVEKYSNVFHRVGIVTSLTDKDIGFGTIMKAVFPGGSITGCPKIRSMEVISDLEQECRGVYTGSAVLLSKNYFDSSILIRTIIKRGKSFSFRVGGGVVYDSDPLSEYEETLSKGETIMKFLDVHDKSET
ncbi:MAG: chorismate-binding protein [Candidatus Delongbacteria bacterium]|nr:chorismate-binding protein [Candidatus Delongbacteria bacterium]MBN2835650.1 chorismate-binding protein [Candidatus Delongbacteria bacterium]